MVRRAVESTGARGEPEMQTVCLTAICAHNSSPIRLCTERTEHDASQETDDTDS
jgi:hypothetical protein